MAELNELGRPVFVIVNVDIRTSSALTAAINRHYQSDFDVETSTWRQGAALLRGLHEQGRAVALIITDFWPDAELGMELVTEGRRSHPHARRALLVGAHEATALFVLIGTEPRTKWLASRAIVDETGYVLTGRDLVTVEREPQPPREPLGFETSVPGVFA